MRSPSKDSLGQRVQVVALSGLARVTGSGPERVAGPGRGEYGRAVCPGQAGSSGLTRSQDMSLPARHRSLDPVLPGASRVKRLFRITPQGHVLAGPARHRSFEPDTG